MAWYDKLRKQGIVVRATVSENDNSFYENIEDAIEDVYIQCKGSNRQDQIFCHTASVPYLRNHTYECCIYSYGRGMNILRDFYSRYIKDKDSIRKMVDEKEIWLDDKMVSEIIKDGRITEIIQCDGEVYFKCEDLDLIQDIMSVKTVKGKSKDPFNVDYYIWEPYSIPEEDLQAYEKIKRAKYGDIEFGSKESLDSAKEMKERIEKFLSKNNINLEKRRELKIKDNKCAIHALGLWQEYLSSIQ